MAVKQAAVWFEPNPAKRVGTETPAARLATASALARTLMRRLKVERWTDVLESGIPLPIRLTVEQVRLLDEHGSVLAFLGPKSKVIVCSACNQWMIAAGTMPKKCSATLECTGDLVSSVDFRKADVRPEIDL